MPDTESVKFEAAANLIAKLSDLVNAMGGEKDIVEGLRYGIMCQHRTLQASMIRVLLRSVVDFAADADANGAYDLRNKAAINTLMKIRPIVQDNPIPFI